jgi:hypothetical protein
MTVILPGMDSRKQRMKVQPQNVRFCFCLFLGFFEFEFLKFEFSTLRENSIIDLRWDNGYQVMCES